jgi:short-subunit dehydrogenase
VARKFARQGARLGLLARGSEGLSAVTQEVEHLGSRGVAVPVDVADAAQVEAAADKIEASLGPIQIWINNAMTSVFAPFKQLTPDEFRRVTEVTYLGYVYGTMAALKRMLPRNQGCVVQVGSALAYRSIPLQSAYCGAKHAIRGFTDSIRSELIHDHSRVRLTMVQLPAINTPQFDWVKNKLSHRARPLGRVYQPEAAAEAIYWAAHSHRREVSIGVPSVEAIVGNKVAPGLLDRYLARTGFAGQQTGAPLDPNEPYNLWEPVAGDHGAHGRFDKEAHGTILQLWVTKNRNWLGLVATTLLSVVLGFWMRRRSVA